jgi:hypothetical protein
MYLQECGEEEKGRNTRVRWLARLTGVVWRGVVMGAQNMRE